MRKESKEWTIPRVESGIPIPDKVDTRINFPNMTRRRWPFGDMKVGDSFKMNPQDRWVCRIAAHGRRNSHPPFDYILRLDSKGDFRLWRTK